MKNNSKNRALKFIREKNYIRKGGIQYNSIKILNEMINEVEFIQGEINYILQSAKEEINKKYKLNLNYNVLQIEVGMSGDDFVKGLKTIVIKFARQ